MKGNRFRRLCWISGGNCLHQFLVCNLAGRRSREMREPERGKRVALINGVAERFATAVRRNLAMELPVQRRVLLDVQLWAAFVKLACERLELLQFGRAGQHGGSRRSLNLECVADHEVTGHVLA